MKDKVAKQYPDFVNEVETLTVDQLKARIVSYQQQLEESEAHKRENEDLNAAREEVKLLSGPYRDVKQAVNLKTRYIIELLKEKNG